MKSSVPGEDYQALIDHSRSIQVTIQELNNQVNHCRDPYLKKLQKIKTIRKELIETREKLKNLDTEKQILINLKNKTRV